MSSDHRTPVVAIHHRPGSWSDRWIEYCVSNGVSYKLVDAYADDIVERLRGAAAFLWHFAHDDPTDLLMARHVLQAAASMGLVVFPDVWTSWHFDDKVAQKYLFEATMTPAARAHVFYDLREALRWIDSASFPKVFKLRRGAGSANVRLARTPLEARKLAQQAFGAGFEPFRGVLGDIKTRLRRAPVGRVVRAMFRLPHALAAVRTRRKAGLRESGYIYFQDFLAGNDHDTRVTVINGRAFGFTRAVRPNDFRASGSGQINHDPGQVDLRCVRIAIASARRMGGQSLAYDFALDENGEPLVLEVGYAYLAEAVHDCLGYWDEQLTWHAGHVWPQDLILEDVLVKLRAMPAAKEPDVTSTRAL